MASEVYKVPTALDRARSTLGRYRGQIESGVGQAQTVAAVGGASYLAARLSAHLGGPDGKAIMGVPLELAIGAACGALAMSGSAGKHSEEVLAVGLGAIAAYTARLGFQAGMQTAQLPRAEVGAPIPVYQVAAPAPFASLPPTAAPAAYELMQEVAAEDPEEVGADPYADASSVLDQYGRR